MSKKPNILFLFTDQQRADTVHALGNGRIQTPALDEIASEALVFDRCYTPAPVCVPARFAMFAGQYCNRTGCCNNNGAYAYRGDGFYRAITEAGYQSCCVGKMHHVRDPYGPMGFQRRYTQEELAHPEDDYTSFLRASPYSQVFDYNGQRSELYYVPQVSQIPAEYHPTQWVGDRSVEFLRQCDPERPFFLMASFIHPHPPFAPPAPWNKLYRGVSEEPYLPDDPAAFQDFLSQRFTCEKIGVSRQDLTLLRNFYYACISFVDYQIGRILEELKRGGQYENTVIVFSSDHGEMLGDFGTLGKRSMLDGAARVPLLLRVPGRQGEWRHQVCSLVDLAPTLLRCAGVDYAPGDYDGLDLLSEQRHEVVYSQYSTGDRGTYMVAGSEDRLIYHGPTGRYYYFDTTPEIDNRYDPENPRVRSLQTLLEDYRRRDICDPASGSSEESASGVSRLPYGPKRVDHAMRREEERARIPAGYQIDL